MLSRKLEATPLKIGAYTISREPSEWNFPDIPWLNLVDDTHIDKYRGMNEYLLYIAEKRNYAVNRLIDQEPDITDILCVDSSYVNQTFAIERLILDYEHKTNMVLGGAIYGPWRQRARDVFKPRITWSDPWGVPDLAWTKPNRKGLVKTTGVSGVHVFPIDVWKRGVRYRHGSNEGTETTFLARDSGLDIMVDMDAMFYRDRRFSRVKCLRISSGMGTKLRKLAGLY